MRALRRLGASYAALDVDGCCPAYPPSWRVHTLAQLERRTGPEVLVQLDTDTLFLGDIGPLREAALASARPVDFKGMGSTGPGDPCESYWIELCGIAGIEPNRLPWVNATVDGARVRATHNAGFVAARRSSGLFARAEELFRESVRADLRPHAGTGLNVIAGSGEVGVTGSEWWGSSQAVVSVAAATLSFEIEPLDDGINVPIYAWDKLQRKPDAVTHAHYHWLLSEPLAEPNVLLDGSVAMGGDTATWLRARVPLRPPDPRPWLPSR